MLSPVGPALHDDGGSRPRSANSCGMSAGHARTLLIRFIAMVAICLAAQCRYRAKGPPRPRRPCALRGTLGRAAAASPPTRWSPAKASETRRVRPRRRARTRGPRAPRDRVVHMPQDGHPRSPARARRGNARRARRKTRAGARGAAAAAIAHAATPAGRARTAARRASMRATTGATLTTTARMRRRAAVPHRRLCRRTNATRGWRRRTARPRMPHTARHARTCRTATQRRTSGNPACARAGTSAQETRYLCQVRRRRRRRPSWSRVQRRQQ